MGYRCAYIYPDKSRCVYTGVKIKGDMCPDHRLIEMKKKNRIERREINKKEVAEKGIPDAIKRPARKRPKLSQPSRVQSAKEVIDKIPEAQYISDPSAPWCTCHGGCQCKKPTYDEWARARKSNLPR